MTEAELRFSAIETALYLRVFGDGTRGDAKTAWVRTLFGQFFFPFVHLSVYLSLP